MWGSLKIFPWKCIYLILLRGLIKWMYVPFWFELKFSGNLVKRKIIHPLSKPTPHLVTFNFSSIQVKNMCQIVQKSFNKRHSFNTFYCCTLISKSVFQNPQIMSSFSSPKPSSDLVPCGGGIYSHSEQIELQKI